MTTVHVGLEKSNDFGSWFTLKVYVGQQQAGFALRVDGYDLPDTERVNEVLHRTGRLGSLFTLAPTFSLGPTEVAAWLVVPTLEVGVPALPAGALRRRPGARRGRW